MVTWDVLGCPLFLFRTPPIFHSSGVCFIHHHQAFQTWTWMAAALFPSATCGRPWMKMRIQSISIYRPFVYVRIFSQTMYNYIYTYIYTYIYIYIYIYTRRFIYHYHKYLHVCVYILYMLTSYRFMFAGYLRLDCR